MFFFVQRPISEVPRPIATKLCHIIGIWLYFIIQIQKFRERSQKILGAKNVQNFGRFFATSDFDCEYLWKGLRYPNRNSKFFYVDSSRVLGNKSRELWSTNFRDLDVSLDQDLDVSLDPIKCTFWACYISALRGCCALKFLHPLQIDQGYLMHTPTGTEVSPKNFNREN